MQDIYLGTSCFLGTGSRQTLTSILLLHAAFGGEVSNSSLWQQGFVRFAASQIRYIVVSVMEPLTPAHKVLVTDCYSL